MPPKDPIALRESFLAENSIYSELEAEADVKPIGKIEDIDVTENEIWLLQCPKGMNLKSLENEKLKIPGRTSINDLESVSVDFVEGKQQHSFAYCSRNGRYDLRVLPVRGTIVLRNRLKASESITEERISECCPPMKKVPLPSKIRVRHPLLGFQYEDKLEIDQIVKKRLLEADQLSAEILKQSIVKKLSEKPKQKQQNTKAIEIDSDNEEDDEVQFVGKEVVKKKKRKHSESNKSDDGSKKKKKSKKSKKGDDEEVSKDLQWLQNL
ncbi:uncharacterized protein LOC133322948 [Musca vetustissima]|uniref:uncharacterized protein LOC133322948 n=1 Tax=Musca vetustissima TaxID=27455 RepID=UPI002AB661F0|nr:uncharacterized protein LOC133322948 [Musca vetustissima]